MPHTNMHTPTRPPSIHPFSVPLHLSLSLRLQGVALLPFIDEARLLAATEPLLGLLEPEETFRNSKRLEVRWEQLAVAGGVLLRSPLYVCNSGETFHGMTRTEP
jgi:hypothetical protein